MEEDKWLEKLRLIIHCESTHTTRLVNYINEEFGESAQASLINAKEGLFEVKLNVSSYEDTKDFVYEELFGNHIITRVTHRFYFCEETSNDANFNAQYMKGMDQEVSIRLQCYPRSLEHKIGTSMVEYIQQHSIKNLSLNPKNFTSFISVVRHGGIYYHGIAPKELFYAKDEDSFAVKEPISRAYYKIREVFDRSKTIANKIKPDWKAIDLGAAPGGWTKFLSERLPQGKVIAIDPAALKIEITPNIVHLRMRAEEATQYLTENGPYDCMVCDIAQLGSPEIMELFGTLVPHLKSGAPLVWTIKLRKRSELSKTLPGFIDDAVTSFKDKFGTQFENIQVIWLMANKSERTIVAEKK